MRKSILKTIETVRPFVPVVQLACLADAPADGMVH